MAVTVAIAIPLVLVALMVAPALLVIFANPTTLVARLHAHAADIRCLDDAAEIVGDCEIVPERAARQRVMNPELMMVAGAPETPIDPAPSPCTIPKFVSVLLVVPQEGYANAALDGAARLHVTPTAPVPGPPADSGSGTAGSNCAGAADVDGDAAGRLLMLRASPPLCW